MRERTRAKASSLFLLELMLAICFFAVSSAVCVQIFVHSHRISREADALTRSVNLTSTAAELISSADSEDEAVARLMSQFPELAPEGDGWSLPLDDAFAPTDADEASHCFHAELREEGTLLFVHLWVSDGDGASIHSLELVHHLERGSEHGA